MRRFDPSGKWLVILPGCIVCKTCEFLAPEHFRVPEKALSAVVVLEEASPENIEDVFLAIRSCPEKIIKFRPKS